MITKEMLQSAAAKSWEIYLTYLLSDYDPKQNFVVSEGFEKKIKKLKRRADHPIFYSTVRRIAAVLVALLIAGSFWIAIDAEARAAFWGWINDTFNSYFIYHFSGEVNENAYPSDYRPQWVPDGYSETAEKVTTTKTRVTYSNSNIGKEFVFVYYTNQEEPYVFVETSDTKVFDVQVNNHPAKLFLSEEEGITNAITWVSSDDILFYLSGYLDESELIRIAESVERITK